MKLRSSSSRIVLLTVCAVACAFAVVILIVGTPTAHAASATFSIQPGATEVVQGQSASFSVSVTGDPVTSAELLIAYDPGITVASCSAAGQCDPAFSPSAARIVIADSTGLSGQIGAISFNTPQAGSFGLSLNVVSCNGSGGQAIQCGAVGSELTVLQPTKAPTPPPTKAPTPPPTKTLTPTPGPTPTLRTGTPVTSDTVTPETDTPTPSPTRLPTPSPTSLPTSSSGLGAPPAEIDFPDSKTSANWLGIALAVLALPLMGFSAYVVLTWRMRSST